MPDIQLSSPGVAYPLLAPAGLVGAPSYSFTGDPTTGLFYSGGNLRLAGAGVETMRLTGNAATVNSVLFWGIGLNDVGLSRVSAGILGLTTGTQFQVAGQANGQSLGVTSLTENVIIAAAPTSVSVIQLPAGAILLGVTSRVTTVGVTAWPATYSVAVGATTVGSGISTALNTTDPGTLLCPIQKAAATPVTITPIGTPGDALGRIRVTIHYLQLVPATS